MKIKVRVNNKLLKDIPILKIIIRFLTFKIILKKKMQIIIILRNNNNRMLLHKIVKSKKKKEVKLFN